MTDLPLPDRSRHDLDTRIAMLEQDRLMLLRYPLRERFGADEHDRNMLAGACGYHVDEHRKGRPAFLDGLASLESDVAAFLLGGAKLRHRNRHARDVRHRDGLMDWSRRAAVNLAAAYRPEGVP